MSSITSTSSSFNYEGPFNCHKLSELSDSVNDLIETARKEENLQEVVRSLRKLAKAHIPLKDGTEAASAYLHQAKTFALRMTEPLLKADALRKIAKLQLRFLPEKEGQSTLYEAEELIKDSSYTGQAAFLAKVAKMELAANHHDTASTFIDNASLQAKREQFNFFEKAMVFCDLATLDLQMNQHNVGRYLAEAEQDLSKIESPSQKVTLHTRIAYIQGLDQANYSNQIKAAQVKLSETSLEEEDEISDLNLRIIRLRGMAQLQEESAKLNLQFAREFASTIIRPSSGLSPIHNAFRYPSETKVEAYRQIVKVEAMKSSSEALSTLSLCNEESILFEIIKDLIEQGHFRDAIGRAQSDIRSPIWKAKVYYEAAAHKLKLNKPLEAVTFLDHAGDLDLLRIEDPFEKATIRTKFGLLLQQIALNTPSLSTEERQTIITKADTHLTIACETIKTLETPHERVRGTLLVLQYTAQNIPFIAV